MNRLKSARIIENVKYFIADLKNKSKLSKTLILLTMISVLSPLSAFYMFNSQLLGVGIFIPILVTFFILLFIYLFTPETTKTRECIEKNDNETTKTRAYINISTFISIIFFIVWFFQFIVFNLILDSIASFGIYMGLLIIFMPNSKPEKKKRLNLKHDKRLKLKCVLVCFFCIISAMILGWTHFYLTDENMPNPLFGRVDQSFRREGIGFNFEDLEYEENLENIQDITFNSLLVLKLQISAPLSKEIIFHAELVPKDVLVEGDLYEESQRLARTHVFSSDTFRGPFTNKDIFFQLPLDNSEVPILPGEYILNVFYIARGSFLSSSVSPTRTYNITIVKDSIHFNPDYSQDFMTISRRGSIYSLYNDRILGYDNIFKTRAEDSLGNPVIGNFELYLTQREGNAPVYKKVTDLQTASDGLIFFKTLTRNHYKEYQRGKIVYDGAQSLYLKTTTHFEDSEIAQNKFLHTSSWPDRPDFTYSGLNFNQYNTNQFNTTTQLYYHTEFNVTEIQWTKSPSYSSSSGSPTYIYIDISDDLTTYIESPVIGYLGTIADYAHFQYVYELDDFGNPDDTVTVNLKSQIYRDGSLVYEQYDYQGFYNTNDGWQTVNMDLTDYFTEAGQQFQIKLQAEVTFEPSATDIIRLKFDHATLEVHYPPVYYRGFGFQDGFNQFSSPTLGSSEPLYWDVNNPIALGSDILTYNNYPGLITNNLFSQDYRFDSSWASYSGLFSDGTTPIFDEREDINLGPTWREINGDGMAVFDLLGTNPPINVSSIYQSVIKDEFTSVNDTDDSLFNIRQRFVVPKIISNDKYIIIVFAARYSQDDMWKIYMTYGLRPDGIFSSPQRIYDPGDDAIYQLSPSIALSSTDLYLTWQQRNRDTNPQGETEWNILYGRISLDDFTLKEVMNVTTYDSFNLDKTAMMAPDIALTPLGNVYNENGRLIHTECMVHISYENVTYTTLTQGVRDNEDLNDISKNIYYSQLSSTYFPSSFSTPFLINDYTVEGTIASSSNVPDQPTDFSLLSAVSDWLGDLQDQDFDYTTFFPSITNTGASALQFLSLFDENSGSSTFDEMSNLEGLLKGNSTWTTGLNNSALDFDGIGLLPTLDVNVTQFSMPTSNNFSFTKGSTTSYGDLENIDSAYTNLTSEFTAGGGGEVTDTFGNPVAGATKYGMGKDNKQGSIFTLLQDGEIIKISAYAKLGGGAKDPKVARAVIYNVTLAGVPDTLMNVSNVVFITSSLQWYDFSFTPTVDLPDGDYWIGLIYGTKIDMYGDVGSADQRAYNSNAYPTPDTNFGTATTDDVKLSIYVTYNYTTGGSNSYDLDTEIEWKPSETVTSMEYLNWSYVNSTAINFYVYNWASTSYEDFSASTNILALGDNYYNSSDNRVKVKFNGTDTSEFTLDINQLRIEYNVTIYGDPNYKYYDYILFGDILDQFLVNEFIISLWLYPTSLSSNQSLNGIKNTFFSKNTSIEIGIDENNKIMLYINTSTVETSAIYGVSGSVPLDDWTRIIVFYNNSDVDVNIGGILYYNADSGPAEPWQGGGNLINGGNLTIGAELGNYSAFTGKIDQIKVYNQTFKYFPAVNNLTFTSIFNMSNKPSEFALDTVNLYYGFKTNISQSIDLSIFNYNTQQYDIIDSGVYTDFFSGSYTISSSVYYNQDFEVIAKLYGENSTDFKLYLDLFRLNYSWTVPPSENAISFNPNLESPQIISSLSYNTSALLEDSTEILINFDQTNLKRVFELTSLSVVDYLNQQIPIFNSESEFVRKFGNASILFDQNKILLPDDLQFHDLYDPRTYYFADEIFESGTLEYNLDSFIIDDVSLVKKVKDVYYSPDLLNVYVIERDGQRLSRDNYSIIGTWGTNDLNITFNNELPSDSYFYVKYTVEDYNLPLNLTVTTSNINNEIALIYERYLNNTHREIFLDVSDETFMFQGDILISNSVNDNNISRQADIKYDYENLLNIIYSTELNSSASELAFKLTKYNSSSGQFTIDQIISDSVNYNDYEYYKLLNPILNLAYNSTLFIAYESNYKKVGESQKWKIQYMYVDLIRNEILGPFYVKSSDSTQERNADSYWSNGLFWAFTSNSSDDWEVEFTSSHRADLNSFSTLSADFLPRVYNQDMFTANMSIYFDLDLSFFENTLLESEDQVRFIVSLEENSTQYILLDSGWNSQELGTWIENILAIYYPDYLRYYYDLSFSSLTFSEINGTDIKVQSKIYPFELKFPYPINFTEDFNLRFNLIKDDWSLNSSYDLDRYQLGIDNVDVSFKMIPINSTDNTFGVITKSDGSSSYAKSEFLLLNKIGLEKFAFSTDENLNLNSNDNIVEFLVDFDAFSLLYDPIQQLLIPPSSDLEAQLMIMVENNADPDLTISDEIIYDSWTGYQLVDLQLESYWTKNFGKLYYSLNLNDYTVDIYDKEDYFELSIAEKQQLFTALQSASIDYSEVYIILQFKVKTFDLNDYNAQNGINLRFNELGLTVSWNNGSIQEQDLSLLNESITSFEKLSKQAYLNLISDDDLTINGRDDFIVLSSFSNGFYPSGSNGNNRYYLPVNQRDIAYINPADYLNLINLHITDCMGYNDTFNGMMIDGPQLMGEVGLISPNLYSNETSDYQLRAILELYPFFNYQEGTDLDKTFSEFKDELLKLKLEVYNQYNSKILSKYSNTIIRMQDFDIADFNSSVNSLGEKYYYMDSPLKIYIYGQNIVTNTEYIYLKFTAEFLDTFYVSTEKTFRSQWGILLDSLKLEFIMGEILPELINIAPYDIISGVKNIDARAIGNDYEWAALYYNYKNLGPYDGYDLITNVTQFTFQDDYSYFNFDFNTTELVDDSIYKLLVVFQDNKGFQGNLSISNITIINSPPDINATAFDLTNNGWDPIFDLEPVSGTIKISTTNNDNLPLTKVTYYFNDEVPTQQNKENWTKIIDYSNPQQVFDHFISTDEIPNGTWYIISEAFNGGPTITWNTFINRTIVNHFENAINIINNDTIGTKDSATLILSNSIESRINYAKFWAQKQGENNWTLLNNATYSPFSAPFINLPWSSTTVFHLLVELQMTYSLFGIVNNSFTKENITLDLDGPTISVSNNPDDLLYQIQQAGGTWITPVGFNGLINGSISSSDTDFATYKVSYSYGKGFRDDSHVYSANDALNWQIKYVPDGDVLLRITGYDSRGTASNVLEFSFVNDQNFFTDLYIENYAFDQIYNVFESFYFKIFPLAQDLMVLNLTVGNSLYNFERHDVEAESLYFDSYIEFDILDFDFENQTVDTQIITIKASDLRSQEIEMKIPITMSLGIDTQITVNDLKIEKDFYDMEGISESTWWRFDEGNGVIIYDAVGNNDGSLIGRETWTNGKVGGSALRFDNLKFIASTDDFAIINGTLVQNGTFDSLDNNYTRYNPDNPYYNTTISQSNDVTLKNGAFTKYGDLDAINGNYSIIKGSRLSEWSSSAKPDSSLEQEWTVMDGTPHHLHVDEDPYNIDAYAVGTGSSGLYERYGFENIDIGSGVVTQVKFTMIAGRASGGTPQVNLYFDGAYQGWKDIISDFTNPREYVWTGLNGDQTDVNNMQVRFKSDVAGMVQLNVIHAIEAQVYYEVSDYLLDLQVDKQITDSIELLYSHKSNISTNIDLDIWNWISSSWYNIESVNNYNTFDGDSFLLNPDFINSSDYVRFLYSSQSATPFELQIDRLQISSHPIVLGPNPTIKHEEFELEEGAFTKYGNLETIDGNYSKIIGTPGYIWSSAVSPISDIEAQWAWPAAGDHYLNLDDDPDNPDGEGVSESTTSNLYERYGIDSININGGTISQVKVRVKYFTVGSSHASIDLYFDGAYQGWKTLISDSGNTREYIWTGLSGDQTDANNMQVRFISSASGIPSGNIILAFEVQVYYEVFDTYYINAQIDKQANEAFEILYSHKTNVSANINLDIWNWTSLSWYNIESVNNYNTFNKDSFLLNPDFINSSNYVRFKYYGQTTGPFELQIDKL